MSGDAGRLLDLLGSQPNRRIVALASDEPVSADDVADHVHVSRPTAYRHLDDLVEADLVRERVRYDEAGDHYSEYETAVTEFRVTVEDGTVDVDVERDDEHGAAVGPGPDTGP